MADPANAGNKDHSYRSDPGNLLGIMASTAGHDLCAESQLFCSVVNEFLKALVGQRRMTQHRVGKTEASAVESANLRDFRADAIEHLFDLFLVEVAQLKSQNGFSRNHVVCTGLYSDPADGANLASGNARDHLIHLFDESGSREQSIMTLIHRSCASVIGKSFDRDIGVQNSDDTFHHTNVDLLLPQVSALLDV